MSVINDMLRDLDKRHALERSPDYVNASSTQESMIEPQKNNKFRRMILLLMILLAIGWSLWFMFLSGSNIPTHHQAISLVSAKPVPLLSMVTARENHIKDNHTTAKHSADNISTPINLEASKSLAVIQEPQFSQATKDPKVVVNIPEVSQQAAPKKSQSLAKNDLPKRVGHRTPPAFNQPTPVFIPIQSEPIQTRQSTAQNMKVSALLSPVAQDKKMADDAYKLFQQGAIKAAYRNLYEFIASKDIDIKSRITLAAHLMGEARMAEAGDVLMAASSDADPDYRQLKARWQVATSEPKQALLTLQSALPDIREFPDYYALLASYYQQFAYPELALKTYTDLVQFDGNVADWWVGLAIAADQTKQWLQAEFGYKHAQQLPDLNPQLTSFVSGRIEALSKLKRSKPKKN